MRAASVGGDNVHVVFRSSYAVGVGYPDMYDVPPGLSFRNFHRRRYRHTVIVPADFRGQAGYLVGQDGKEHCRGDRNVKFQAVLSAVVRAVDRVVKMPAPAEVDDKWTRCSVNKAVRFIQKSLVRPQQPHQKVVSVLEPEYAHAR